MPAVASPDVEDAAGVLAAARKAFDRHEWAASSRAAMSAEDRFSPRPTPRSRTHGSQRWTDVVLGHNGSLEPPSGPCEPIQEKM